jgi:NADH:ubiquinone oxidoreductase subunit K
MIVSLVVVVAGVAVGVGLIVAMYSRDEPMLGGVAVMVLTVAAAAASVYGALSSF